MRFHLTISYPTRSQSFKTNKRSSVPIYNGILFFLITDILHCAYLKFITTTRTIPPTQLRAKRYFDSPVAINIIEKKRRLCEEQHGFDQERWQFEKEVTKSQNVLTDLEQMRNEFKSLRVKYLGFEHSEFHYPDLATIHFLDRNPNFFVERNHRLCSLVLPDLPLSSRYFAASWKRISTKLITNKIRGRANMVSKISIRLRNCAIVLKTYSTCVTTSIHTTKKWFQRIKNWTNWASNDE